ncbi:putative MFS transporter [Cryphonectria parasitica EP155]|uniref:MFS transporter n=1 Tax=Cryphonectria parasitica (strain ATCC 38755 / EP155) TaxID=660469 RepID=A0A9P5CML6_CRYP1|nr:putative MFS transporter [Cryphonectria parasitica EP155]KAF3763010.1 putative MFS transporter [Cryphonectria parasitica EP155]
MQTDIVDTEALEPGRTSVEPQPIPEAQHTPQPEKDADGTDTGESGPDLSQSVAETSTAIHGPRLWLLIAGMMLGVYLVGLDTTMLATVIPTLTDYFGTISDVSWYGTSYVIVACVFIPLVGRIFTLFRDKFIYLTFMVIFLIGSIICAVSTSSSVFILGRAVNGLGSAGLITGALLVIRAACEPRIRPAITSATVALIPLGSATGPLIAGALTSRVGWRWCFWIFLPIGGFAIVTTLLIPIPDHMPKPAWDEAVLSMRTKLDPVGFVLFAGAATSVLLATTWGGTTYAWSSATIIGLFCGFAALSVVFTLWILHAGENALIPPSTFRRRSVTFGSAFMFLQGGATQMISYYLPYWFQAIKGDSAVWSAIHMLPSILSQILALITFGTQVRRFQFIPPWGITGSVLSCIGAGLITTFSVHTSTGRWIGYQIIASVGRGMAFQVPIISIQETVPAKETAAATSVANLFMQFGTAISISASQSIFDNRLPDLLSQYAPDVDASAVLNAGATEVRGLVAPSQLPGFLLAYNEALVIMFYFPVGCSALAALVGFGLPWNRM